MSFVVSGEPVAHLVGGGGVRRRGRRRRRIKEISKKLQSEKLGQLKLVAFKIASHHRAPSCLTSKVTKEKNVSDTDDCLRLKDNKLNGNNFSIFQRF